MKKFNKVLTFAGVLSCVAALLHIAIIIGGSQWYRFFRAGEELVSMAENGSWYPALLTFGIAVVFFIWALYAFSGAGLIGRLPCLKVGLVLISSIYLVRGLAFIPVYFVRPEIIDVFLISSSLLSGIFGFFYALGTKQAWKQ